MSGYLLKSEIGDAEKILVKPGTAKTGGVAALIGGTYGFYLKTLAANEEGMFVTRAALVEADVDSAATYGEGDIVYDHATVPTGVLNKTSASRRAVGYSYKTNAAGSSRILIVLHGGNG